MCKDSSLQIVIYNTFKE